MGGPNGVNITLPMTDTPWAMQYSDDGGGDDVGGVDFSWRLFME